MPEQSLGPTRVAPERWALPVTAQRHPLPTPPTLPVLPPGTWGVAPRLRHLQRSIRPQVVTTFELPGCYDMWTVLAPRPKDKVGNTASAGDVIAAWQ